MSAITLSAVTIRKLIPISYLGTGSDYCEIEFEVPDAEATDMLTLVTGSAWLNQARSITWAGGSAFNLKCVSIAKAYNGTANVWRIRCVTNSPATDAVWGYIGAMLKDYGDGTTAALVVTIP